MAVMLRYISEFGYLSGVLRKSLRSLSHLLMSSCSYMACGTSALSFFIGPLLLAYSIDRAVICEMRF